MYCIYLCQSTQNSHGRLCFAKKSLAIYVATGLATLLCLQYFVMKLILFCLLLLGFSCTWINTCQCLAVPRRTKQHCGHKAQPRTAACLTCRYELLLPLLSWGTCHCVPLAPLLQMGKVALQHRFCSLQLHDQEMSNKQC